MWEVMKVKKKSMDGILGLGLGYKLKCPLDSKM